MAMNLISSKDANEEHSLHLKSDDIEVMMSGDPEEIIEEFFESLLSKYQIGLEIQLIDIDFIFHCGNLMHN